jgi:site-specific recombinase XerD
MASRRAPPPPDLPALLQSWEIALRVQGKRPATIEQYTLGVRLFLAWCTASGHEAVIGRELVRAFLDHLMDRVAPGTVVLRHQCLRQFSRWLASEGELPDDPLLGIKPPKVDVKVTTPLTDDELRLLLKMCVGKTFRDRRDEAVVRLMAETGMRVGELLSLTLDDVSVVRGLATINLTKGRRGRVVPFGPVTAQSIDRYIRARKGHRLAGTETLWLGDGGRNISYHGLRGAIMRRAELAGIKDFHLHMLRHTYATRWLRAGGSEGGLMAVAGWKRREMIDRYVAATAGERAADEARGLALGDL